MTFTLRSDAAFGLGPNRMMISNSAFDLGGNTLTVIGAGGSQGQFDGCTFSNGGHIVVGAHMTFMAEAGSLTFEQPASGSPSVTLMTGENVTYGEQPVAGMLAFAEGATFTIADEAAFSNAVVAAGSEGLVVARANWVFGDSTLVNGMAVVLPQPSAGMAHRWEMVVGSDHTTLRLKFAAPASGYAAWSTEKGISGAPDEVTNGIANGVRYAFDIDPASSEIGEPIMQVVSDADGNPAVLTRDLAEGRSDVKFGILATTDLSDWSNAKLVPMEKAASDGLWKPSEGKKSTYVYPAQMFFKYTIEIR